MVVKYYEKDVYEYCEKTMLARESEGHFEKMAL